MSEGWIKLHRCLFKKAIWLNSTAEQKVILITLLGIANHSGREWEWMGKQFKAEPGMLVTSLENLSCKSGKGITVQNVRSALNKFEKYEFLTQEVTKTGRLVTIVNWSLYQDGKELTNKQPNKELTDDQQSTNKEPTNSQQTGNKEVTTNKNDKNNNNDNNDKNEEEIEEKKSTQLLPFPSKFHEEIFNLVGEVGYKTWFIDSAIKEDSGQILISVKEEFKRDIIQSKYINKLTASLSKEVSVRCTK